jgi:quercetin dioxygenase-like cupin family protein
MSNAAFVIADDHAVTIANDNCDFRYRASREYVPVGVQVAARTIRDREVQILVEDGFVEFMIGGATAIALPGDFVRVPAGVVHAWRNTGDTDAHLLRRTVSPRPARRALRVGFAA